MRLDVSVKLAMRISRSNSRLSGGRWQLQCSICNGYGESATKTLPLKAVTEMRISAECFDTLLESDVRDFVNFRPAQ